MPEAELVRTGNLETPRFTKEPVDLIYLGSMSESHQELAIRRLLPHAGVLRQYVESGGVLLATAMPWSCSEPTFRRGSGRFRRWACSPATPSGIWSTGTIPCFWVPLGT